MSRLNKNTALITGGSTGIGLATARRFLAEGARVAIAGSDPAHLEEAKAQLGREVIAIGSDPGDVAGQREGAVGDAFGRLDVVVLNAGIGDFRPIEQSPSAASSSSTAG